MTWIAENVGKQPKTKLMFLEKQKRITKMAINKMSKTQHGCTEIQ